MSIDRAALVREFHEAAGQKIAPCVLTTADLERRSTLVCEEAKELCEALTILLVDVMRYGAAPVKTLAEVLKELCDLIYVAEGLSVELGVDVDEAFRRVHESNMSKFPMSTREDGKVMKGPNYQPPYLEDLVR